MRKFILLFCLCTLMASVADAAIVRLVEDGVGLYRLEGEGLADVASFDLTIDYDTSGLNISSVTQGELLHGGLFATNINRPGQVRIGVILSQPVFGSGTLVHLSGTVSAGSPVISSLHSVLSTSKGTLIPVQSILPQQLASHVPEEIPQEEAASPDSDSLFAGSPGYTVRTTSGLHPETQSNLSRQPVGNLPKGGNSSSAGNSLLPMGLTGEYGTGKEKYLVSVLERFKRFEGERTLINLRPLFDRKNPVVRQSPPVAMSDGKSEVTLMIYGLRVTEASIALRNARFIGIETVSQTEQHIKLLPEENVVSVDLFLLGEGSMVEIPLAVAPPVSLDAVVWQGEEPLPQIDLNGDGKWSPIDDYILVANLMLRDSNI